MSCSTWYSECLTDASDSTYAYRGQLPGRAMSLHDQCMHYNAGIPCSVSLLTACVGCGGWRGREGERGGGREGREEGGSLHDQCMH